MSKNNGECKWFESWTSLFVAYLVFSLFFAVFHVLSVKSLLENGFIFITQISLCHLAFIPIIVTYHKNSKYLLNKHRQKSKLFVVGWLTIILSEITNIVVLLCAVVNK